MVHCDLVLLQQLHEKTILLLQRLHVTPAQNQATPNQEDLLPAIIVHLDRSLLVLQEGGQEGGEGYCAIEEVLQRQESLNRGFIRRELEFKEYQKCVMDELAEEKKTVKGLQEQLIKANQRALAKDLQLLQLGSVKSKELKKKQLEAVESLLTERKLGNPFKSLKEGGFMMHRRGNSDQLTLRSSSSKIKKKINITKK